MFSMPLEKHFTSLRDISDNVDDYLLREIWREDFSYEEDGVRVFDDDITPKDILGRCYLIIIEELKDYGIHLIADDEDTISDIYTCGYLYLIRKLVDYSHLVSLLQATDLVKTLHTYLQSDEIKANVFSDLVEMLISKTDNLEITELGYMVNAIYTTEEFEKYLLNTVQSITENKIVDFIPQLVNVNEYIDKIKQGRAAAKYWSEKVATELLSTMEINFAKLNKLNRDYDMDKISPDEVGLFSLIDNDDEINPALLTTKFNLLEKHHKRSPHHIEYWLYGNGSSSTPSIENLIMLVVHHAEPMVDSDEFKHGVNEMLAKAELYFGEDYLALAKQIRDFIATELDGEDNTDIR